WTFGACTIPLLAGLFGFAQPAAADLRQCQVAEVSPKATLSHGGTRSEASVGTALSASDLLQTGPTGRVEVACSDGTHVTVGPDTEINLGSLVGKQGEDASIGMSLHRGIARFLAPVRTWRTFNVFGPVAVASVRSTEWIMETPKRGTNVFVLQGVVEVQSKRGAAIHLSPTYGVDVTPDGTMAAPKKWGASRVATAKQKLGLQ
ncbi:MAG TPA: FecR family protein, partial [Dongiaceae bacterium]